MVKFISSHFFIIRHPIDRKFVENKAIKILNVVKYYLTQILYSVVFSLAHSSASLKNVKDKTYLYTLITHARVIKKK